MSRGGIERWEFGANEHGEADTVVRKFEPAQLVRVAVPIDRQLRRMLGAGYMRELKRHLCAEMAKALMERCEAMTEQRFDADDQLTLEVTINDLGTYRHLATNAAREGMQLGRAQAAAATAYGVEPGQFYE